jgi:hypothetical protein
MRFLVVICASIVALTVFSTPVFANVTAATISTVNPNYVGPCPVTITFTGSITAAANTTYSYGFVHFLNGKEQPGLFGGGTGSGSITVKSDTMTFTTSDAGAADQIDVHGILTGPNSQPDYYSNKLSFTVTCVAPPTPTPSSGLNFHNPLIYQVAPPNAPTNLKQTTNEQECGAHGFGFGCPLAMSNGWLVLVWCWQPAGCSAASTSQSIKAFNVYEVDNGKHVVVDNVNPDNSGNLPTAGAVQTPANGFANQCYAVTAVMSNGQESGRSNAVCLGNGTVGNVSTTYHATASTIRSQSSQYGPVPFRAQCDVGPLCLGWQHDQSSIVAPNIIPIWWYADNYRAYYRFDGLNALGGHYIASATLHLPLTGGQLGCFSAIAASDTDWTQVANAYIGGNFISGGSIASGLDVTSIVRAWVSGGTPNYGFVLRGSNENLVAESSKCKTDMGTDATIDVVHS